MDPTVAQEGKLAITRSGKGRLGFDLAVVEAWREEQQEIAHEVMEGQRP